MHLLLTVLLSGTLLLLVKVKISTAVKGNAIQKVDDKDDGSIMGSYLYMRLKLREARFIEWKVTTTKPTVGKQLRRTLKNCKRIRNEVEEAMNTKKERSGWASLSKPAPISLLRKLKECLLDLWGFYKLTKRDWVYIYGYEVVDLTGLMMDLETPIVKTAYDVKHRLDQMNMKKGDLSIGEIQKLESHLAGILRVGEEKLALSHGTLQNLSLGNVLDTVGKRHPEWASSANKAGDSQAKPTHEDSTLDGTIPSIVVSEPNIYADMKTKKLEAVVICISASDKLKKKEGPFHEDKGIQLLTSALEKRLNSVNTEANNVAMLFNQSQKALDPLSDTQKDAWKQLEKTLDQLPSSLTQLEPEDQAIIEKYWLEEKARQLVDEVRNAANPEERRLRTALEKELHNHTQEKNNELQKAIKELEAYLSEPSENRLKTTGPSQGTKYIGAATAAVVFLLALGVYLRMVELPFASNNRKRLAVSTEVSISADAQNMALWHWILGLGALVVLALLGLAVYWCCRKTAKGKANQNKSSSIMVTTVEVKVKTGQTHTMPGGSPNRRKKKTKRSKTPMRGTLSTLPESTPSTLSMAAEHKASLMLKSTLPAAAFSKLRLKEVSKLPTGPQFPVATSAKSAIKVSSTMSSGIKTPSSNSTSKIDQAAQSSISQASTTMSKIFQ